MAFLAPFIAGAIGLTGTAALVGEAIIGVGLSFGLSYLARRLQPKQSSSAQQGMRLSLSYDVNGPREIPFGIAASAGSRRYFNTYGPNGNDYLQLVFKLGDVPCTSLETFYANGKQCTLGSFVSNSNVTGYAVTEYPDAMWVQFHDGAWAQTADADLVAKSTSSSPWTTNDRGRGVCYVRVTLKFNADLYKDGIPSFLWVFKGAKFYDWRKDDTAGGSGAHRWGTESTYEWTANPFVILYNYKRGIYVNGAPVGGMNVPDVSLPLETWTAAANAADEDVARYHAGGTENRYEAHGIISVDTEHATVVRDLLAAGGGDLADTSGVFKVYAGVAQSSVLTITDDDILSLEEVQYVPKLSRGGLVNAVFGSFNDPAQLYEPTSLPPRISPADEVTDGDIRLTENYGLTYVSSGTQGQRLLELLRRKGRYQRSLAMTLRARAAGLEACDWITYNSARYGFSGMLFQVQQSTLARDATTPIEIREISTAAFAWTPATDELNPLSPATVGSGNVKFTTVAGLVLANITALGAGGQQRPGLHLTWTPVTDSTVTSLKLEYRKVGDTVAIERNILDPASGDYAWFDGVQGGLQYECRLLPITQPERSVTWTGWTGVGANSADQIVAAAEIADAVPPDTITPEMLSAQTRFELQLITATDNVLGSLSQQIEATRAEVESSATSAINALLDSADNRANIRVEQRLRIEEDLSLAEQITSVLASFNSNAALVQSQITALSAVDQTLASDINTVSTRVDGQEATVVVIQQSINGIEAKFGVAVTANGEILGLVQLDGDAVAGSTFTVVADNFKVAAPGVAGGSAVTVFSIQNVNGVAKLAIKGDMLADGTITAQKIAVSQLSALTSDLGTVIAGIIRNSTNTMFWNLSTGDFQIS